MSLDIAKCPLGSGGESLGFRITVLEAKGSKRNWSQGNLNFKTFPSLDIFPQVSMSQESTPSPTVPLL